MPISSSASFSSRKSDERNTHGHELERETHEFERSPYTSLSTSTLNYTATNRIALLAKPKKRIDSGIRDGFSRYLSNPTYSGVSHAAAKAEPTARIDELALPVKLHKDHQFEYPSPRPVSRAALRYRPSSKVTELARPRKPPTAD